MGRLLQLDPIVMSSFRGGSHTISHPKISPDGGDDAGGGERVKTLAEGLDG